MAVIVWFTGGLEYETNCRCCSNKLVIVSGRIDLLVLLFGALVVWFLISWFGMVTF